MRLKNFLVLFSLFFIATVFLPKIAMADSTYQIQLFGDANNNGIYDPDPNKNPKEDLEKYPVKPPTQTVCYDGFVPCGKILCKGELSTADGTKGKCKDKNGACLASKSETEKPIQCQLCHSFIMIDKAVDYVIVKLVPLLAVLMLVIGGVMFYFGGVRPELLTRARTLIKGVVIGLVLIYSAYMIVNIFLMVLGASEMSSVKDVFSNGVFSIKCPVYVPEGLLK